MKKLKTYIYIYIHEYMEQPTNTYFSHNSRGFLKKYKLLICYLAKMDVHYNTSP